MPRRLTNNEIEAVKNKLNEVAEELLKYSSIRKISVEDLTKKANIAKGTFYHFYETKEMLFYDVFRKKHDEIQEHFINDINRMPSHFTPAIFTAAIMKLIHFMDDTFIFNFIQRGDLEFLMRSLPESAHLDHLNQDQLSMRRLSHLFPNLSENDLDIFSAAIRLAMVSILFKKEIGKEYYESALELTLIGIVSEMMEVNHNDKSPKDVI